MKFLLSFALSFSFGFSLFGKGDLITITLIDPVQEIYLENVEIYVEKDQKLIGETTINGDFTFNKHEIDGNLTLSKSGYISKIYKVENNKYAVEISLEMTKETKASYLESLKTKSTIVITKKTEIPDVSAYYIDSTYQQMKVFIQNNLNYPSYAINHNIQGRVQVRFVVEEDGKISNIRVVRGVSACLDREAILVVSKFPNWTPALREGKPIISFYQLPINFALE